jgi:hypothetical protein
MKVEINRIADSHGWHPIELEHALDNLDLDYGEECVLPLVNGREIRCPAYPEPCTYVRIVDCGYELAYWVSDEWGSDPMEVMGAILGCAGGAKP